MTEQPRSWLLASVLVGFGLALAGCSEDPTDPNGGGGDDTIPVPTAYTFESRFEEGVSSVAYPGQVVRNLLMQDLKIYIDRMGSEDLGPVSVDDLLRYYEYDDAYDMETLTVAADLPLKERRYSAIATEKDLVGKTDGAEIIGYGKTADELIRGWMAVIAANSEDPEKRGTPAVYTSADGVNLSQMIQKVLLGAVAYSQMTGRYLHTVLDQDNTSARGGTEPFTAMEHFWDEAFGYFGAARDYGSYSDAELAGSTPYKDSDGDGAIDLASEYNFDIAKYAAKRDRGSATGTDFTAEIFQAFLAGRTAIVNQGTTAEITEQRDIILEGVENVIAANVVHYVNDTLEDMAALGTGDEDRNALAAHWAEAKAFAVALQFNPHKRITDAELAELHGHIGLAPSYAEPGTTDYEGAVEALNAAKDVIQSVYGFAEADMDSW